MEIVGDEWKGKGMEVVSELALMIRRGRAELAVAADMVGCAKRGGPSGPKVQSETTRCDAARLGSRWRGVRNDVAMQMEMWWGWAGTRSAGRDAGARRRWRRGECGKRAHGERGVLVAIRVSSGVQP